MILLAVLVGSWLGGLSNTAVIDPVGATGFRAVGQNPAALGQSGGPIACLDYAGARGDVSSTGSTLGDYTSYLMRPVRLSGRDKQTILDHIPGPGLQIRVRGDADLLQGQYRGLGWALGYRTVMSQALPRDLFVIALQGNELNRSYSLDGWGADTVAWWRTTVAYGLPVFSARNPAERVQSVLAGLSLSWLHGTQLTHTTSSTGELRTTPFAVSGRTTQLRDQATAGDGFSIDAGFIASLGRRWRLGVSTRDLVSSISWYANAGTRKLTQAVDSLSVGRYLVTPVLDSFIVGADTFRPAAAILTRLPGVVALGAAFSARPGFDLTGLLNVPLVRDSIFRPPFLVRADWQIAPAAALGLTLGWRDLGGLLAELSLSSRFGTTLLGIGIAAGGPSPSLIREGGISLNLGREF